MMIGRNFFVIVISLLFIQSTGHAQIFKKRKLEDDQATKKALPESLFHFPNVNNIPYYRNSKLLAQIQELEEEQQWKRQYLLLKEYVSKFGIQNFYKDTFWLWRLAKLTELFGELEDAKRLYRLVLKHHREDIDIRSVELYYDSLTKNDADYYVPLDYYYELVEYRKEIDTLRPPRGVLLNMGELVNSSLSDYGPTLSYDDNILIFTSKRNIEYRDLNRVKNEDLFFSFSQGGYWGQSKPLKTVNTPWNEGSACLSRDAKILYFSRCHSPNSYGNCDLFVAKMQPDSSWGEVENLGVNVNSIAWDSHPSLSHTEDTLYFASDRIGGFGLSDIYFTYRLKDGRWSTAQNIGPVINTRGNEVSPFYHPKFELLYFSSNGHLLNFGEYDIYKSQHLRDIWAEPKNIGPLVNGKGSEFYFTIDTESDHLYYARSTEDNLQNLDLYSFPLPMGAQPEATATLKGSLRDIETGEPFRGIVSIVDLKNGIEVAPKYLRPDGTYEFKLINNQNYLLILQGEEFFRIEEIFFMSGDMEINKETFHIASKMEFSSIEFELEKADLLPAMFNDLNKIINFLLDNPDFKLRISGHTDSYGSPKYNMELSQKRAEAIKEYIILYGTIDPSRVEAVGYGDTRPIVEEKTEEDKKLNRRVEFEIYREGS